VAYEHAFVKEQLGTITVADLDALWKEYFRESNRDIILTAPATGQGTLPDEATLNRWIGEVTISRPAPMAEMEAGLLLMTSKPAAGKVTDRKELTALGITELTLSNGVKVILKPTSFKNDEILLQGFSPGGTSLYGNKDFMSATAAADLIAASGVGGLNAIQLPKVLSGKQAGAKPFINERFEGIGAAAGKADLETALQLVYLYMTAPRKDSTLYQVFMKRQVAALQNRGVNPANVFTDTINAVLGNNHYRRTAPSLDKLNTLSLDRLYAIYKERFADAGDFTFVMVGSFTVDAIVPLLEQYLGGLPSTHHQETATDLGIRMPQGKMVRKVYKGQEDKATVRLVFNGPHQYNQLNNLQLDALKEVLQLRLTERLREAEGGVYSPSVNLSYTKYPTATFTYTVAFDCAPANADKLVAATLQEIDKLKTQGPPAEDVQKNRTAKKRQWETMQNSNEFWYGFLANVYMENESPDKALTYLSTLDQITPLSLQQTAKNCFDGKNVIEFVLLPGAMQQQ
jgi:zinc protease